MTKGARVVIHSITDVTRFIKTVFDHEQLLQGIMVRGEISNFKQYASGHCYFVLKDAQATLKCVMFRRWVEKLAFLPENGMQVVATGNISVYERDGVYQLYVENVIADGSGALAAAFAQLKRRLADEGLFDEAHKKPLPPFPKVIGIVTSASGAVLRDIHRVSKRRWPGIKLVLYPAAVQGVEAAEQIARGIAFFNEKYPVDILIVGRGGGSIEDLWSFNEEVVVRAVFASRIPIISAVGHETDYTLSDFAADVRAATPSQAAELAVPDGEGLLRYLASLRTRLQKSREAWLHSKRMRLSKLEENPFFRLPVRSLAVRRQRLDMAVERFHQLVKGYRNAKKQRLDFTLERMELLNPIRVLRRGYGILSSEEGMVIRRISQVQAGQNVEMMLADGRFSAQVKDVRKGERSDAEEKGSIV